MATVDPGFTDVVALAVTTAVRDEGGNMRLRGESDTGVPQATSYSSARYYERSKINESRRLTSRWNRETEELLSE